MRNWSLTAGVRPLITGVLAVLLLLFDAALVRAQELQPSAETSEAAEPAAEIPLKSPDAQIRQRLVELYREVEGLRTVGVQVREGVVTLTGATLTAEDRGKAEQLAARLDGVVSVENRLTTEHRVDRRLQPLVEKSQEIGRQILTFLPLVLVALLTFVGFWLLGRFFTRRTRLFKRLAPNQFIETLLEQVVRLIFIIVGLVVAMSILGATALIGSVLGAAGVIGLAVGFAVRDTIENYIASVLLSLRQPFAPNDAVIIEGFEGRITRLNARATILTTFDGNEVRIPNATVYKANIVNYTHTPERRFEFEIGIGYENDAACALALALNAVKSLEGVLAAPAPFTIIDRVDPYAVVIKVFGWVDQSTSDYGKVKSEAIRLVLEALARGKITIAEPVHNIRHLPDPPSETAEPAAQLTSQELNEIKDTRADKVIARKVEEIRSGDAEDLLAHAAPRE